MRIKILKRQRRLFCEIQNCFLNKIRSMQINVVMEFVRHVLVLTYRETVAPQLKKNVRINDVNIILRK